ncbi:MAG: hypothetical protein J7E00_20200, partial [Escherichia coli]|nr:hypothetical protein [Escherichia coli]
EEERGKAVYFITDVRHSDMENRPFAAHKSLANVRAARVKIGSFPRRARRNLRYTTRICYNNSLYRVKSAVTPAFLPFKPCLQTG